MAINLLPTSIQRSFQSIIDNVRTSGLNFSLQETPFSVYFSIRKSQSRASKSPFSLDPQTLSDHFTTSCQSCSTELESLKSRCQYSDECYESLKEKYEGEVNDHEVTRENLTNLKTQMENLHNHTDHLVAEKVKVINDEKRGLQIKHEKTCSDFKILQNENVDLTKEVNQLKVALRSAAKEFRDEAYKNTKKVDALESKIKDLYEFKKVKAAEEKELKIKVKIRN